jgi:hypothetical protein
MVSTAEVTGRVTATSGTAISGATVITNLMSQATTTKTGEYVLKSVLQPDWKPRIVIFYAPGFRDRRIGAWMKFALPPSVEVGKYGDVDYSGDRVVYRFGGKPYVLATMTGPQCCSGRPVRDEDVIAAFPNVRTWVYVDPGSSSDQPLGGLDMRGKTADGMHWRWLGPPNGALIEYRGAPEEVSRVFDAIIDSMCIPAR